MAATDWLVRVRQNSNLTLLAEVDDFHHLTAKPRYNAIGEWVMDLSALSPWASYLTTFANGLIVERDIHDGNGFVPVLSGPITRIRHTGGLDQMLQISGASDEIVLQDRQVEPNPTYPIYASMMTGQGNLWGYWRLGETSGTNAADASGNGRNGTYAGTYSQGFNGGGQIDDADKWCHFTSGKVTLPTAGLPTGNSPWTIGCWATIDPGPFPNFQVPIGFGKWGTNLAVAALVIDGAGAVYASAYNADTEHVPLTPNVFYCLGATYDGITLTLYVNGVAVASMHPGTLVITLVGGGAVLSMAPDGTTQPLVGRNDEAYIATVCYTPAQMYQIYATGLSRYNYQMADHQSAAAETAMKHYVAYNDGSSAVASRQVSGFTIEADSARGATVPVDGRWGTVLQICQDIAAASAQAGTEIGFRVVQSGSNLQFQNYLPADKTNNAKFSQDLGTLLNYSYQIDRPQANHIFVGGAGSGQARVYAEVEDSSSVSTYGLIEGFLDARSSTDSSTLGAAGNAALIQNASQTNLTIQPADTDGLQVFRDYNVGDKIASFIDGGSVTNVIRELQIDLSVEQGAIIMPGIGNPGQGQIEAVLAAYRKELQSLKRQVQKLQGSF